MSYVVIATAIIFLALAVLLTEKNARYLLSGYNTMSEEERKYVDLRGLLAFFKRSFVFIGLSFLIVSLLFVHFLDETIAAVFICLYPIITCIYMLIKSQKFQQKH